MRVLGRFWRLLLIALLGSTSDKDISQNSPGKAPVKTNKRPERPMTQSQYEKARIACNPTEWDQPLAIDECISGPDMDFPQDEQ